MKDVVIVRPERCVGCNVCVRCCPAEEANYIKTLDDGRRIIAINAEKCIGCGECIKDCPHGARDYVDDTEVLMSKLNGEKMIILVDPAIKAAYPTQWKNILDWFKKKGCLIFDASYGADIYCWAMLSALETKKMGNMISPACAAVVNYIKLYQPALMKNLAPLYSPGVCMAVYIKNYLRRSNRIAMLSPCIAKKMEYIDTGLIDFNITFKKVMAYFSKNDIVISSANYPDLDYEFEDREGQMGAICARPGGLRDNIVSRSPEANVTYAVGATRTFPELDLYIKTPEKKLPSIFDVLSCDHGCCFGPGVNATQNPFEVMTNMNAVEVDIAAKMSKNKGMFRSNDDKLFKKFDEELEIDDFLRSYRTTKPAPMPTSTDLEPIYESMGKTTDADKHFNCGACGYKTCKEMATAIYRGLSVKENCFIYEATKNVGGLSEESLKECNDLSAKIKETMDAIGKEMEKISQSNDKNCEKTKVVNDLLKNVVAFCGKNATMDENSVSQMIKILETTIKSMAAYDENAGVTKESSEAINKSLGEIGGLVESLNAALAK